MSCNVIIKQGSMTPSSWKKVMVKVLYKQKRSDETRKRSNILYLADVVHMFSTMLYNTAQQARQLPIFLTIVGFEKIQTTGHLMAYRLIVRKSRECEQTSGRQRSIFKTPFDSIRHDAIWRSLRNHSTSEQHICFLKVCMLTNAPLC